MAMRDEFGIAECPHCGGEVRIKIHGWTVKQRAAGITEYTADYGTPRCKNRCTLTDEEKKKLIVTDHVWEDW